MKRNEDLIIVEKDFFFESNKHSNVIKDIGINDEVEESLQQGSLSSEECSRSRL